MAGQGRAALPVVPPPVPDERLSSWLARIADRYLVTVEELQAHVGWAAPLLELELRPGGADVERIAQATSFPASRIVAMTFAVMPERYLSLLRLDGRDICPACTPGLARPPQLKSWAFAFGFWCERHRRPLFGTDRLGLGVLGDEAAARFGARRLAEWARGGDDGAMSVGAAVSLLLSSRSAPSPPAPWELACLSPVERQRDAHRLSRRCRRPVLSLVVPEFDIAVPVCDQRVPTDMADLASAPWAVRYAVAIALARLMKDTAATRSRILAGCDPAARRRVTEQLARWPWTYQRDIRTPLRGRPRQSRKRETA